MQQKQEGTIIHKEQKVFFFPENYIEQHVTFISDNFSAVSFKESH